ncbi:MAG TPA: VOC family protein [Kofleriaceae bacterium]|jgi:hypothetical protein
MQKANTSCFVWYEYLGSDLAKAQGFFGELFGWGTRDVPMPNGAYTMISTGDHTIGGYRAAPEGSRWRAHLGVTDAAATAAQVKSLGGVIVQPAVKASDFGTMAIVRDPQGAELALWQPTRPEPPTAVGPGHFCWTELTAESPEAAAKFYCTIGGFTSEAMEMPGMGKYTTLRADGEPRAGIMAPSMPAAPRQWLPYVAVASADKTADKAKRLGAQLYVPPTDIPGVGRFAIFGDPQGAPLGILQPSG